MLPRSSHPAEALKEVCKLSGSFPIIVTSDIRGHGPLPSPGPPPGRRPSSQSREAAAASECLDFLETWVSTPIYACAVRWHGFPGLAQAFLETQGRRREGHRLGSGAMCSTASNSYVCFLRRLGQAPIFPKVTIWIRLCLSGWLSDSQWDWTSQHLVEKNQRLLDAGGGGLGRALAGSWEAWGHGE